MEFKFFFCWGFLVYLTFIFENNLQVYIQVEKRLVEISQNELPSGHLLFCDLIKITLYSVLDRLGACNGDIYNILVYVINYLNCFQSY